LGELSKNITEDLKKLEKKIWHEAGEEFNINSTQQLQVILFEKLKIDSKGITRTKTGISTSAEELQKLKHAHPIVPLLQEYRELAKLLNTYIDALPELVNPKTGRVHTSFNQAVTATGRLSSTDPNLQNIPIRTELGREIRKAFVADKGYKLLSLDYSQIELRIAAHMSGDEKMIDAFKKGLDIHAATAAEIHGVKLEEVTKEMRREAKAINFGTIYGQGPHGLSQVADIPYAQAKKFIDNYFQAYIGIKKFIDLAINNAEEKGYAETLFGRRRYLPDIHSRNFQAKRGAERIAINTPLQGTAADMIKAAMIQINRDANLMQINKCEFDAKKMRINSNKLNDCSVRMLLQVHDELLFEVKEGMEKEVAEKIKNIMENVIKLNVPIIVDARAGENWGEMEKI